MISSLSFLSADRRVDQEKIDLWFNDLALNRSKDDLKKVRKAIELIKDIHGNSILIDGMDRFSALIHTADIINALKLDTETLISALLSELPQVKELNEKEIEEIFGTSVLELINQVAKIREFSATKLHEEQKNLEKYRQLLLDISSDIRSVMILLAKRLRLMRRLKYVELDLQQPIAFQTHQIHAPLANLLGIWQIKWELEDLCFRFLKPNDYQDLVKKLDIKRKEREFSIDDTVQKLKELCLSNEINANINGRPKHIFSIWNKMQTKSRSFEEVLDMNAARVLVETVAECYEVLSILHAKWQQIPSEFCDYIVNPKKNGYQSLHTAIFISTNKPVEIQIRTYAMHEKAERGIAAHWRYKENYKKNDELDRRINWIRTWLLKNDDEYSFVKNNLSDEVFDAKRIFVLTPNKKVIDLPKDATPIDFAYSIHTSVGHRCRGAKVNGKISPLSAGLVSGDIVEIITTKDGGPSRDWLSKTNKYVVTSRAKSRIRQWFNRQDFNRYIKIGRDVLEDLVRRQNCKFPDLEKIARKFGFSNSNEILAAIGHGEVSGKQVINISMQKVTSDAKLNIEARDKKDEDFSNKSSTGAVIVNGVGNLMTTIARCCSPLPQDPIIGYITRGRGITVHRSDCHIIRLIDTKNRNRLIATKWSEKQENSLFVADLKISLESGKGAIQDISSVFANLKVDVIRLDPNFDKNNENNNLNATIAVSNLDKLQEVIEKLRQISNVLSAKRSGG